MKHEDLRDEPTVGSTNTSQRKLKKIGKRRFGWPVKRPGVGIVNECHEWILTAMKWYTEKDHQVLRETHMMLAILVVLKGQERMTLMIWMNLLRSKDWLKLMISQGDSPSKAKGTPWRLVFE